MSWYELGEFSVWLVCIAGLGLAQIWMSVIATLSGRTTLKQGLKEGVADCNLCIFAIGTAGAGIYTLLSVILNNDNNSVAGAAAPAVGHLNHHMLPVVLLVILALVILFVATATWAAMKSRLRNGVGGAAVLAASNREIGASIYCAVLAVLLAYLVEQIK